MTSKLTYKSQQDETPDEAPTEPRYTVQQLLDAVNEELAGQDPAASDDEARLVTPRTLHYYININLLEGPRDKGRSARYSRDHLNRLLLIKRLQEAHLPLGVIRQQLNSLSPTAAARALASLPDLLSQAIEPAPLPASEPAAESAADYIARVLATQNRLAPAAVHEPPAKEYLRKKTPQPEPAVPGRELWERIEFAPGVELHVRQSLDPSQRQAVDALITFARRQFEQRSS